MSLGNVTKSWFGYEGTRSACGDEKEKGVFTCTDMAPIAVNDTLAYAYVAGTADSRCGKCYHLQYDGHFKDEFEQNPPKATHKALKGKHLVVMASNIGNDVAGGNANLPAGQFDLMVPGGGVGAFDALSTQVNKGAGFNWGAGFGGFLTECQKNTNCGTEGSLECYQTCVPKAPWNVTRLASRICAMPLLLMVACRTCCAVATGLPTGIWLLTIRLTTSKKWNARST